MHTFQSNWGAVNWAYYDANSIKVGDANWTCIPDAARTVSIYVSLGFSEIEGTYAYMAQALIPQRSGPDGAACSQRAWAARAA